MMRFLIPLAIIALGVMIYAFIECIQTPSHKIRTFSKGVWLLIIALVPAVGAVLWLVFGHKRSLPRPATSSGGFQGFGTGMWGTSSQQRSAPQRPRHPDDDEEFLRRLDIQRAQKAREEELNQREAELRAREQRLNDQSAQGLRDEDLDDNDPRRDDQDGKGSAGPQPA